MASVATDEGLPEVVLYLKDGTRINGLLVADSLEAVVLRIAGIDTPFSSTKVDRYETLEPVLTRYTRMRAAIGNEVDQIVRLAEWLRDRDRLELAYIECERALAINPLHPEAKRLFVVLEQQIRLKMRVRPAETPGGGDSIDEPASKATHSDQSRTEPPPVLTPQQINLIKVFEVDLANRPRVVIPRATMERMLKQYVGHPLVPVTQEGRDALLRKSPLSQLELMFRLQAREYYGEVQVVDMPPAIRIFREDVQRTWLVNSCATTSCHGGEEAGRLFLINRKPNSDAAVFTNLLILDRFRLADGRPLINYDDPPRSPLLQLGLPREDSLFPHPEVPRGNQDRDAWRRTFRSTQDEQFKSALKWIEGMYRPRPEYPVDYTLPGSRQAAPVSEPPPPQEPIKR